MNRDLAKKWTAYKSKVTVYMLPYRAFGFADSFNELMGDDYSDQNKQLFAVLDYCTLDVEIAEDAPTVWQMFKCYMEKRKQFNLVNNWDVFQQYGSVSMLNDWNIAYENTRETLLSDTYYDSPETDDQKKA